VNASAHNAAEGDKKSFLILPPKLTAKPPPFAAKAHIRASGADGISETSVQGEV
jgi:hypothetical protein